VIAKFTDRVLRHSQVTRLGIIVLILFLNNLAVGAGRSLLPVYIERDLGLSPAFSGALLSIETALGGMISIAAGAMADRLGHRLVLVIGIVGFSAGLLQFVTGVPWLLVLLAVILGLAHGMRSTAGQSYLLNRSSQQSVGVATAAFFLGGTIGTAVSAAVAGPLIEAYGFGVYAVGGLFINMVPAVLTVRYLHDVRPKRRPSADGGQRSLREILMRREVFLIGGLRFFPTAFWGVWSLAIPLLIFRATGSVLATALYGSAGMGLSAIGQFAIGRWSDRIGRSRPIFTVLSVQIMVSLVVAIAWEQPTILIVAGILGVVGGWAMSVLVLGTVRDRTTGTERGRVVGFVHALWSFGFLTGTLLAGLLLDLHPTIPLLLATLANVAALFIASRLFREVGAPAAMSERLG
jgi:MFS family permease